MIVSMPRIITALSWSSKSNEAEGHIPMLTKRDLLRSAAMGALAATMATSTPALAQSKPEWPSILEAKDIAEEGFIYGLPLVMNYAVMHEFAVDPKSEPVQGAVQPDRQPQPRGDLRRHGGRHAQQRHAVLDPVAGSARRADGDLRAGGGEGALLFGAADRRQYLQLWLHRQPRDGQRSGLLSRRRTRLERREACRHQAGLCLDHAVRVRQLPDPAHQRRGHAERREGAGRLQDAAAVCLPEAARAAGRPEDRLPAGHDAGHQGQLLRLSRCRPQVRAAHGGGQGHSCQARPYWRRPRQDRSSSRTSRSLTNWKSASA